MLKNLQWFVIAIILIGLAFIIRSPYMAYALYAFLLLLTLSSLTSWLWLIGLDCERSINLDTVQQGDDIEVSVTVTNRRGFPIPWIFIEDLYPEGFHRKGDNSLLAVLMPGRSMSLKYSLTCPRRGYHRIGPILMESGDLFGLQRRFRSGKRQDYVSVLPTVAYIDTFNVASRRPQGPVRLTNRIYEDPTRIVGLREYAPGDPLNRIHWKATARTGELFVKTNEPAAVIGGTLILDLHKKSYPVSEEGERWMELAITTTASIAYLLQMSGEPLGLLTNARDAAEIARYEVESRYAFARSDTGDCVVGEGKSERLSPLQVPTFRSPLQARKIIENLARVVLTDGLDVENLILNQFARLPRDSALLPVLPCVSETLALTLASMRLSGFNVTVFLVGNDTTYQQAAERLAVHDIYTFHIEREENLHEISPARIGQ